MRPRNLDRSARRDVASSLNRMGLAFSGADLFLPPAHLSDRAHQDRAFAAIRDALECATELSSLTSSEGACVTIPAPPSLHADLLGLLTQLTDSTSATLALLTWPVSEELRKAQHACPKIGIAFDPSRVLAQQGDPAKEITRLSPVPASLRLSDFDGVSRVPVGAGNLDLLAYGIATSIVGAGQPLVLDLGGLPDAQLAAQAVAATLSK